MKQARPAKRRDPVRRPVPARDAVRGRAPEPLVIPRERSGPSSLVTGLLAGVSASALMIGAASALPQNGTVVGGSATITQTSPNQLDIKQTTDKAIINWQGFSIGAGERTN